MGQSFLCCLAPIPLFNKYGMCLVANISRHHGFVFFGMTTFFTIIHINYYYYYTTQ